MKDHGNENSSTEVPVRALKSLLKKPGQTKGKGHKNRVVINEKLNEFFAADYIILIKEECCTDYEEECDCCCQEHEMIRLGNCKECRAELNLHFGGDGRFGDGCEDDVQVQREQVFGSEESLGEEEEEEEEDEENDEDDEEEPVVIGELTLEEKRNVAPQRSQHQQRETLSPPEGYKDLCVENELGKESEHRLENVCAECNYYQRATGESRGSYFSPIPVSIRVRFTLLYFTRLGRLSRLRCWSRTLRLPSKHCELLLLFNMSYRLLDSDSVPFKQVSISISEILC